VADYITLVNKVARRTGWGSTTSGAFSDPGRPWDAFKEFLNEAKDDILDELGIQSVEQEFVLNTVGLYELGIIDGVAGAYTVVATPPNDAGTAFVAGHAGRKLACSGFDGWMRIATRDSATQLTLDAQLPATFTEATFDIFEDEYDLDASVRRVVQAWNQEGPIHVEQVSETHWLDRRYPGAVSAGTPREMSLYRSETTGMIWRARFRPVPDGIHNIRMKCDTRLVDLSASTDEWEIAKEIENFIVDRTVFKALASKVINDPDLALTTVSDLRGRVKQYRDRNYDPQPSRRLRRMAPDELPTRERVSLDPTRFH
jgi:hypothetical protein